MGIFQNIANGLIDIVKLVFIAVVCLVVIIIGGYLLGDLVGLIPEATGLHRTLSVQTFLTDLPFIGANMIYLIIAMAILVIVVLAIELYSRKVTVAKEEAESEAKVVSADSSSSTAEPVVSKNVPVDMASIQPEKPAAPEAPKIKP